MKTEVYSWRVATDLKCELERQARDRRMSVAAILDQAAREWLSKTKGDEDDEAEQARIHAEVAKHIGTLSSRNPHLSEQVSEIMSRDLKRRYGRR